MDRSREIRRGTNMAAVNGGLSRRRQRTSIFRDSPEEDGVMELQETGRLRDRSGKKDRDRDRSISRSKRRRGERILHASNREDGEDTSDESVDEEEDDEDDEPATLAPMRLPPQASSVVPNMTSTSSSLALNHHHHHHHNRKSFPAKVIRSPAVWKVADEMMGVSVPRKARSSTAYSKRSYECSISGSGAGGGGGGSGGVSGCGELMIHRQTSTSPARHSPASTAPISPSSSNASGRKKMKPISGQKHRPPKIAKSPSSVQDIEFEVAEVLFGMTRQFQGPSKQDSSKSEAKEANASSNKEKSRNSSPNSTSQPLVASQSLVLLPPNSNSTGASLPAVAAPKRKRPRPVSNIEGASTNPPIQGSPSASCKVDSEQDAKMESPSPKLEKKSALIPVENGSVSNDMSLPHNIARPRDIHHESTKLETAADSKPSFSGVNVTDISKVKEVAPFPSKKSCTEVELDSSSHEASAKKTSMVVETSREEKFKIDLMALPSVKLSPDAEAVTEVSTDGKQAADDMCKRTDTGKMEEQSGERTPKLETVESLGETNTQMKSVLQEFESKEPVVKERALDPQFDIVKADEDVLSSSREQAQKQQHSKLQKTDSKQEKGQSAPIPIPMTVAGWPGGLPPIGYMNQVPSLPTAFPLDGSNGSSKVMQPPHFAPPQLRQKRCATHYYIAQNIYYHQQITRINPFWPAAPGSMPLFGAKPYNLNAMPPTESVLVNPLQGGFPGRTLVIPDKAGPVGAAFGGHSTKDKNSVANNFLDSSQRKPIGIPQAPQGSSTSNMLSPAFVFPLHQQQAVAAAAARSGTAKSSGAGAVNGPLSTVAMASGISAASAPTITVNYTNLPPNEYLAILQNNGYSFPVPAHVGAAPQYRGGNNAQPMPFFNGPFYASQMFHPLQQQAQPQQAHTSQQGHQNTSTSSGSTSSQKHQSQHPPRASAAAPGSTAGGASHVLLTSKTRQHMPPHPARPLEPEAGGEESPSTSDSRISHVQKSGIYPNFAMPLHPQDYAMMSHATVVGTGNHGDKQHHTTSQQQQNMKIGITPSQAFAMSFTAAGVPPAGLDFSMSQNHPMFQSLPETTRHGYQIAAAAAAAQLKKPQHPDDGKASAADSLNASGLGPGPGEDERKLSSSVKASGGFSQHSLSFRPDGDAPMATILSNSVIDSSARTLNLIPAPVNGNHVSGATPSATSIPSSNAVHPHLNQQQHLIQLQQFRKQQQQPQIQLQQQLVPRTKSVSSSNNSSLYSDRLPSGPVVTKLPNAINSFPQGFIQSSGHNQSSQWKNPVQTSTSVSSPFAKSQHSQQQGRPSQPTLPGNQMQISFVSSNSHKPQHGGPQIVGLDDNPSMKSPAAIAGSPQASASKSAGGSPRASSCGKPGHATTLPLQQQQQSSKMSPTGSRRKSSPVSNKTVSPMLGNPHNVPPVQYSSTKTQHHHQQLPKPPFPQSHLFFSSTYMSSQSSQANTVSPAAATGYYQRRPPDHPQQQQSNVTSSSTGALSLCPPTLTLTSASATSDPAKTVAAANNIKSLPPAGLLQSAHLAAAAQSDSHALMSASGFPYIHAIPSMSVKSVDQKPAAGNGNAHDDEYK